MLSLRFVRFHQTLQKSKKRCIRFLSSLSQGNLQSSYGKNLHNIAERTKVEVAHLDYKAVKENLKYCPVPSNQIWRASVVKDLFEVSWNNMEIDVIENNFEIEKMLEILCTS